MDSETMLFVESTLNVSTRVNIVPRDVYAETLVFEFGAWNNKNMQRGMRGKLALEAPFWVVM